MFNRLKTYLKRYPAVVNFYIAVHKRIINIRNEVKDIRDSYLRKSHKAVNTPYGFKLQGGGSIHHRSMQEGAFEKEETALIRKHLDQADLFVDVGANIGLYSCLARSLGKKVIAVEPLSRNLVQLYGNLMGNNWKDVEVFPVGLSDQPGLAVLYGASSTGASLIGNWAGSSRMFKRVIALSTLDILLDNRFPGKKLFIKIDVEGVEYQVLMGAINTISRSVKPTWLIEICLTEFHPSGINPNYIATFDLFWKNGYEVRTADQYRKLVQPSDIQRWVQAGHCESGAINYFFIPLSN